MESRKDGRLEIKEPILTPAPECIRSLGLSASFIISLATLSAVFGFVNIRVRKFCFSDIKKSCSTSPSLDSGLESVLIYPGKYSLMWIPVPAHYAWMVLVHADNAALEHT